MSDENRDYSLEVQGPTGPIFVFVSTAAIDKAWGPIGSDVATEERLHQMDAQVRAKALQMHAEGRREDDGSIFVRAADVSG